MSYTRKDRMMNGMWSKSSKQCADRFEKNVIKIGIGLGASIFRRASNLPARTMQGSYYPASDPHDYDTEDITLAYRKTDRVLCAVLLVVAPLFQAFGVCATLYWRWSPFFALLLFSTLALLCVGFASALKDAYCDKGKTIYKRLNVITFIESILYIVSNLWPVVVRVRGVSELAYILMSYQILFIILNTISVYKKNR